MTIEAARWTEADAAGRARLAVDGVEPRLFARPTTAQELADTLRQANEQGFAVAPRGGGTQMELGNRPSRLDLVLETTGLNRLVEYEPADLTVTVEAGMRLADLQDLLKEQGQFLALDPPIPAEATIGGVIATNASGPLRLAYGTARDLVIGTRVANPDGRITHAGGRVVKNVAGYDLNKLYVGSLGTVGVIVELSFKLTPIPPSDALVVARFPEAGPAWRFISAILHSPLSPLAIELLGPAAAERAGFGRSLAVAVRAGGYAPAVDRQARDLERLLTEHGGERLGSVGESWGAVRTLPGQHPSDLLVRAAAPIARSADVVELLERHFAPFGPVAWAHAGNGVAYAACGAGSDGDALLGAVQAARAEVVAIGNNTSLVVERCPASLKEKLDVWGDPDDGLPLMRALKTQLDPKGILNPGRFVGGI